MIPNTGDGRPLKRIETFLAGIPDAGLTVPPVPIYRMSRLSDMLSANLFIMRDDLTGFALGGNKVRKLDFLIADARASGADTLVTTGASSFSRNAAAAARVFGFDCHVVIPESASEHNAASCAWFEQCGANLHYLNGCTPASPELAEGELIRDLACRGRTVYRLHPGGSDTVGAMGYLKAFGEIAAFTQRTGTKFGRVLHATGSTATQVGLLLGAQLAGYDTRVDGIAISRPASEQAARVEELGQATARRYALDWDSQRVRVDDAFLGGGYAVRTDQAAHAAALFLGMEGVILDPVYTGKSAAALVAYARTGQLDARDNVLFLHTGGNGGLFY